MELAISACAKMLIFMKHIRMMRDSTGSDLCMKPRAVLFLAIPNAKFS